MDQFIQVKCKFQLTSESESSETIHTNSERIRLCSSIDLDNNSTLLALVCSNEIGNNHIVVYYVVRRPDDQTQNKNHQPTDHFTSTSFSSSILSFGSSISSYYNNHNHNYTTSDNIYNYKYHYNRPHHKSQTKPLIRVKQIYYHPYNEDIVALTLSELGDKLVFISASSTIYIVPIKNILLNLHAKQLSSSQGKSMCFYDASILDCCSIEDPISIVYWDSAAWVTDGNQLHNQHHHNAGIETHTSKSLVLVSNKKGEISFINVTEKKEINLMRTNEQIKSLEIVRDRFTISVLITCYDFKQFRLPLELLRQKSAFNHSNIVHFNDDVINLDDEFVPTFDRKPIPIVLYNNGAMNGERGAPMEKSSLAASALKRLLKPSAIQSSRSIFSSFNQTRDKPMSVIFNHPSSGFISVVDTLGIKKANYQQQQQNQQISSSTSRPRYLPTSAGYSSSVTSPEPRLFRFFYSKLFYYRAQKPQIICKLYNLDPDEQITDVVITDRFLALTTDRDRCLINSRNCCYLKSNSNTGLDLDPLIKEIKFSNQERILRLLKSPVNNDPDGIIDSFMLVTDRSIYSIEARQSCRAMYVNLIDSHLGLKQERRRSRRSAFYLNDYCMIDDHQQNPLKMDSDTNLLLVNNFLSHKDDVYEKVIFDSRIFSMLFKIELNGLYEAYGDQLLLRRQFRLANRFFQMAKFNHCKTLGKYIRLGAYNHAIDYVTTLLDDESQVVDEKERIDLSKAAFDCLLAKTIIERSKMTIYKSAIKKRRLKNLYQKYEDFVNKSADADKTNEFHLNNHTKTYDHLGYIVPNGVPFAAFQICEHNPRGLEAKCSTQTIVPFPDYDDLNDEGTLTDAPRINNSRKYKDEYKLECGRSLIDFVNNYMPAALYPHALIELVDFGLLDLADYLARSDERIYSLIRIILKVKDQKKLIFRSDKHDKLLGKLNKSNHHELIRTIKSMETLKVNIMNLLDHSSTDCRPYITLFKAIAREEKQVLNDTTLQSDATMYEYNLSQLFDNVLLMKLLEKTLGLLYKSVDLNPLSDCLGIDEFMGQVPLPVENVWRQIMKTIQTAASIRGSDTID